MELRLLLVFLRKWLWLILLGTLIGAGGGYLFTQYEVPVYRATTRVLITGDLQDLGDTTGRRSLQELIGTYTQLLLTRATAILAADRLGYGVNPGRISVRGIPNTKLFEVTYESDDPQRAAETLNVLMDVLIEQNDTLTANRVTSSASGLQAQIDWVNGQIEGLEGEITDTTQAIQVRRNQELDAQIATLKVDIANLQREILNLTIQYNVENAAASGVTPSNLELADTPETAPLTLQQETTLQLKRDELAEMQALLTRYQQVAFDRSVLGRFEPGQDSPESIRLAQAQTELESYRRLYSDLVNEFELARLNDLSTSNNVVQVDPATAPRRPLRPRPVANLIFGATLGLLLAGVLAFAVEYLDDTLKANEEIGQLFGVPILGNIIYARRAFKHRALHARQEPRSPVSEALRTLRTNLEFAAIENPLSTILVTSPSPADGKTTLIANLAAVIAQAGQRVLVVDADLRWPTLHEHFGVANKVGLTNLLIDWVSVDEALRSGGGEYLTILPSGAVPPNPTELLRSPRMADLLDEFARRFDVVLIDSSPLIVADAPVLAARVSGVLMVVRYGKTKRLMARAAVEKLTRANARLVGVVVNGMRSRAVAEYGYGRYFRYYRAQERQNGAAGSTGELPFKTVVKAKPDNGGPRG